MSKFDTAIETAQAEVSEAQAKIAELTSRIETARSKAAAGEDIAIDIESATLDDVHAHADTMNGNIADLIMGLDDVTSAFSKDFDAMRQKADGRSSPACSRPLNPTRCARSGCAAPRLTTSFRT